MIYCGYDNCFNYTMRHISIMSNKLIFHYGTVNSSKTMSLLSMAFNYEQVGWNVCTIKPAVDTRSDMIETRAKVPPRKVDIVIKDTDSLYDYNDIINQADVIFVDECQFLTESQIDELRAISIDRNIDILCFGLRTDYTAHLFPASKRLFELADEITEIKTICNICGKKAAFNVKVCEQDGQIVPGWDTFQQRCYTHYKYNS